MYVCVGGCHPAHTCHEALVIATHAILLGSRPAAWCVLAPGFVVLNAVARWTMVSECAWHVCVPHHICSHGSVHVRVVALLSASWDSSYLEKSPPNAAKFLFLQEMFRDAKRTVFVALVRHPTAIMRKRITGFGAASGKASSRHNLEQAFHRRMECWYVLR